MAADREDPLSTAPEEEQEGGPVKTFLEHLEDLRWVLIKSISAAAVAMLLCLVAGNYVVSILKWPLERAEIKFPTDAQMVTFTFGTNRFGPFKLDPKLTANSPLGTNPVLAFRLAPILAGTNLVLGLEPEQDPEVLASGQKLKLDLINLGPAGAFIVATKVAFYAGLVLAAPFIFFFVGDFVFPALKLREKRYVYRGLFFGFGLFMMGVAFCYFVLMPLALVASVHYSEWLGFSVLQWRAEEYISFVCKFMLGMGLGFELPVVVLVLVKVGVVNYRILSNARRYVIVFNFVMGAVLTTPEVITQVLMAIPLQILYEISVWITWYWERQERKRREAEELAEAKASQ